VVNDNLCKGCGLSVDVCPKHVIELAKRFTPRGYHPAELVHDILVDPRDMCTGCMMCSTMCPDAAITVYREVPVRA
jgi:2-oxoglutarate ferredoxin oxidoreductase subunit delta